MPSIMQGALLALALSGAHTLVIPRPFAGVVRAPTAASPATVLRVSLLELDQGDGANDFPEAEYEEALGKLVFSSEDPAVDIGRDFELYDEQFVNWLNKKADGTMDLEERTGLRGLAEMVVDVRAAVIEKGKLVEEEEAKKAMEAKAKEAELVDVAPAAAASDADVIEAMKEVQIKQLETLEAVDVGAEKKKAEEEAARMAAEEKSRTTYVALLQQMVAVEGDALATMIRENYDRCDFKFQKVANDQAKAATDAGNGALAAKIAVVLETVNLEATNQIQLATEQLKTVLTQPSPQAMESSIVSLAQRGELQEALLLLLEANRDQARQAGVDQAADLMDKLLVRARGELDKSKTPNQKLMRQLIRENDSEERIQILTKAFTPVEKLFMLAPVDGKQEEEQPMPEVSPPEFIETAKEMIQTFGNIELTKEESLHDRLRTVISEAEQVSVSIFGESMTAREQQDRMWKDGTVSVFDLETLEQQAEVMGEQMPWHGEMDENKFMQSFEKGRKNIGG